MMGSFGFIVSDLQSLSHDITQEGAAMLCFSSTFIALNEDVGSPTVERETIT